MRLRQVSLVATLSLAAGLTTATVGPAGSAVYADDTAALPLSGYAHLVVDPAHQHVFVSQGAGSAGIVVTDLSGTPITTVAGEQGATGLALSPDGGTLYAALADGGAIAAIDTATLTETARWSTGAGSSPVSVAVAGGRVWYGYTAAWQGRHRLGRPVRARAAWRSRSLPCRSGRPHHCSPRAAMCSRPRNRRATSATWRPSASRRARHRSGRTPWSTAARHPGSPSPATAYGCCWPPRSSFALRAYRSTDLAAADPAGYFTGGSGSAPGSVAVDTDGTVAVAGDLRGLRLRRHEHPRREPPHPAVRHGRPGRPGVGGRRHDPLRRHQGLLGCLQPERAGRPEADGQ